MTLLTEELRPEVRSAIAQEKIARELAGLAETLEELLGRILGSRCLACGASLVTAERGFCAICEKKLLDFRQIKREQRQRASNSTPRVDHRFKIRDNPESPTEVVP